MADDNTNESSGFTLVELLIVIVILGILSAVVVFAVRSIASDATSSGCLADSRILQVGAESYFALHATQTIPTAGGPDGYEQTLVNAGIIKATSIYWNVTPTGALVNVSPC